MFDRNLFVNIFNTFLITIGLITIVFFQKSQTTRVEINFPQVQADFNY